MDDGPYYTQASKMIADYRPDHYYKEEKVAAPPEALILDEIALVHISANRVVIVDDDGGVTVLDRFNGSVKAVL